MLAANGEVITYFYEENRAPVAADQIAEIMKQALVAIEDARFYEHGGLDVQGTLRALVKNVAAGEVQEGGSTLTQQLVKQTLLQSADSRRGARRRHRADAGPQDPRGAAGAGARGHLQQGRAAHPLPQHRLLRAERLRHPGRRARLLRRGRRRADADPGRPAGRARAEPRRTTTRSPTPRRATIRRNQVLARMADAGLHHAGAGGRGGGRAAGPRTRPGPAARLRRRPPWAPTSATSCRST